MFKNDFIKFNNYPTEDFYNKLENKINDCIKLIEDKKGRKIEYDILNLPNKENIKFFPITRQ